MTQDPTGATFVTKPTKILNWSYLANQMKTLLTQSTQTNLDKKPSQKVDYEKNKKKLNAHL